MYSITTPLGRPVRADDWHAYHGDVVLKILYDYYPSLTSLEEGEYFPLDLATVANGTTMDLNEVVAICDWLQHRGLLHFANNQLTLTDAGLQQVEDTLARYGGQ